ncbi:MAG: cellulase family glycosylhydrolase, partial [Acutalibacteraceae bacterium]|nr:cellulase family glycosylhydrolase [Acutalibacteraceae bacterium]
MKKLISIIICLSLILSLTSVSFIGNALEESELNAAITDTSGFELTSIELTEQMLIGYNIGNSLEMTELRSNYTRPEISSIEEHLEYKETMAGNVVITEEYIKYLADSGVQAIRLPVTWFNMLEIDGEIVSKDTYYKGIDTRREFWYNGTINKEFMERVQEIVDWIIGNGMYCILNSHHDGAAGNANAVNPVRFGNTTKYGTSGETYNEQTIKYLTNIWTQIGEHFKDYGSKLLFEPYNEVGDENGSMSPNTAGEALAAEVATEYIKLIRSQGSNNANRFLVIPNMGGVSFWSSIDGFKDADTATDKLIITTHSYQSSSGIKGAISLAQTKMTNFGIGAIIDEIGGSAVSSISDEAVAIATNVRKYSDEYKVSCFWWDNGAGDYSITNRKYICASSDAWGAYVGKNITAPTYTLNDAISLTSSTQPNWILLHTDTESTWAGKYLLMTSQNKITTLDKGTTSVQGYYTYSGAENGLVSYFTSDDGVNFTLMHTVIPTNWAKIAWSMFKVYGSNYYTEQVDGNYTLEKIGDGLQKYVTTGSDILSQGGSWIQGQYSMNTGIYEGEGTSYYTTRICLENKISVTPGEYYYFSLVSDSTTRYQFIVRCYNANGTFVSSLGTVTNGAIQIPSTASKISISLYDSHQSSTASTLLGYLDDGTFNPTVYRYVSSDTNPDPTVPVATTTTTTTSATTTTTAAANTTTTITTTTAAATTTTTTATTTVPTENNEAIIVETGVAYETLTEAITAAADGQTVKLLKDVTTAYSDAGTYYTIPKNNVTIDMDSHAIYSQAAWLFRFTAGTSGAAHTVTFKNGRIEQICDARSTFDFDFNGYLYLDSNINLVLDSMYITSGNYAQSHGYGGMITATNYASNISISVKNSTIINEVDINDTRYSAITDAHKKLLGQCIGFNSAISTSTINIENSTLSSQYSEPLYYTNSTTITLKNAHIIKSKSTLTANNYKLASVAEGYIVSATSNGTAIDGILNDDRTIKYSAVANYSELHVISDGVISLEMLSGASIRLNNELGIRFYTDVDPDKVTELRKAGYTVELGTLITAVDLMNGEELTFNASYQISDVPFTSSTYYTEPGFEGIVGSLVSIKDTNITREFVGRGYAKVTKDGVTNIYYASYADDDISNNTRSLQTVAKALKNDTDVYNSLYYVYQQKVDAWSEGKAYNG